MSAKLGVVGSPEVVANSLSPRMMTAALEALGIAGSYGTIPVDPEVEAAGQAIVQAVHDGAFTGCNVTMPFKHVAAELADECSARVELAGAANTLLVRSDGSVYADATDGLALRSALDERAIDLRGARVLLVGAGGVAVEAGVACIEAGVSRIDVVNRTRSTAEDLARRLQDVAPALDLQVHDHVPIREAVHIVVGCVPASAVHVQTYLDLVGDPSFVDYAYQRSGGATPMMVAAAERGAALVDGRELLVRQGAEALRVWFSVEPPIEVMLRAVR